MRDVFINQLSQLVETYPEIVLITGDLGFGVFDQFKEKFPENFINAGVAEQNMTAIASGMALEGRIIFTYSIGNFPTLRCLEHIRNNICYHGLNVNIVSIGGGFSYGALGISHHATEDLAIMRSLPDITVISPTGLWETKNAIKSLIKKEGAGYLRLDKSYGNDSPSNENNETFLIGKSRVLREGKDCTLIVTGGILEEVQEAAKMLAKKVKSRIISMHTVKPLDYQQILESYQYTDAIITIEEHTIIGGLGSAVAEFLADNNLLKNKFLRIGLEDGFSSIVGSQKYLRKCYGMDSNSISEKVLNLLAN